MNDPKKIFLQLFGVTSARERVALQRSNSMLDRVLEDARSLQRKLGRHDQRKFEEYLSSVRSVEKNVQRSKAWLDTARPNVDPKSVVINTSPEQPAEYLRAMYDLLYLAVKTDSTRLTTYQLGQNLGAAFSASAFPRAVGLRNWHGLGHGYRKKPHALGSLHEFLTKELSRFLTRLAKTSEGDATLLDRTVVMYGSGNAATHGTTNYPLILAGGRKLGMRHGQFLKFTPRTPLSNLYLTLLHRLDIRTKSFADSSGEMTEVLA